MPDHRRHRGAHPQDGELFAAALLPTLQQAVAELSWLLTRGYNEASALKLVGDRHALIARQRKAVSRCACTDAQRSSRGARRHPLASLAGETLHIDGFNVLISIESALSGGLLLCGRDGAHRDLASIHGTYRRVEETQPAIELIGAQLARQGVGAVCWFLDRPVSNSGRVRALLQDIAAAQRWPWQVEVVDDPDKPLAVSTAVVATADSWVLDQAVRSCDLSGEVIAAAVPDAWRLVLDGSLDDSSDDSPDDSPVV